MATIQFSHANGMPAPVYEPLLALLAPHKVHYLPVLGETAPPVGRDWSPLVDELIRTLEQRGGEPVVGLGHSLGAVVTLMAGRRRPDLFRRIIMLDPPLLPWRIRRLFLPLSWAGPALFKRWFPLAKGALRRRDRFDHREEAHAYWAPKSFFQSFDPACFEAYVQHALVDDGQGGLTLRIPRETEAQIFATTPARLPQASAYIPTDYFYAIGRGAILRPHEIQEHQRRYPHIRFHAVDGGHMFPVEQPQATAERILSLVG